MSRFVQLLSRLIRGFRQPDERCAFSSGLSDAPIQEVLPRLLMEDVFSCFPDQEESQLRFIAYNMAPPAVPPFPEEKAGEKEDEPKDLHPLKEVRRPPVDAPHSVPFKSGGNTESNEQEVPTALLRVFSYALLTSAPQASADEWLARRLRVFHHQSNTPLSHLPLPLHEAFACISRGCSCDKCERWGRWRGSLKMFAFNLYSVSSCGALIYLRVEHFLRRPLLVLHVAAQLVPRHY